MGFDQNDAATQLIGHPIQISVSFGRMIMSLMTPH
jgi:hypothetical protein